MQIYISTFVFLIMLFFNNITKAQNVNPENFPGLKKKLITADSTFWVAYNQCDIETMSRFLAEDLEFYHDKGGLTKTLKTLNENVRNGLCGNPDRRLRREIVSGTVAIYIMENYGAIFHGEHLFYINEKGKEEYLDGHAQFTHLWKYDSSQWKMTRVLSYDHKPASYNSTKKEIELSPEALSKYEGKYESGSGIIIDIILGGKILILKTQQNDFELHPESENLFFVKDRALQIEFKIMKDDMAQKLVILEKGQIVDEADRMN